MSPVPVLPPALPGGDTSDILILGALVLDGSGGEPYVADVLLQAGRITAIAARAPASGARLDAPGARRIHADGLALAPGFIDMRSEERRVGVENICRWSASQQKRGILY